MTKEIREQRLAASQPTIIQKAVHKPIRAVIDSDDLSAQLRSAYFSHFIVWNAGSGPALEVEISLLDEQRNVVESHRETFLRAGEEREFAPDLAPRPESKHYIACEYKAIFSIAKEQTRDQSWLPFEVSKTSTEGEVYVQCGELEFRFRVPQEEWIDAFGSRSKPR